MESKKSILFPSVGTSLVKEEPFLFEEDSIKEEESVYICPECKSDSYIAQEKDAIICNKCDILLAYNIDTGPEYRWFGDGSPDPTRVGGPINPLLPESSLATRILWRPGDCMAMRRIRQFHLFQSYPSRERTRRDNFEIIDIRATNSGISSAIVDESKQLYSQISHRCILRKPQRDALLAACMFESLKRHGSARHPKEVADIFCVDASLITRALKQFSDLLEEHTHEQSVSDETPLTTSTTFGDYIETSLLRLTIPRTLLSEMRVVAIQIGNKVDEIGCCRQSTPPTLAATAVALACEQMGHSKSIPAIAAALDISVATLSKCLKNCKDWKTILFSRDH
jgi:transcription initiation factor TFIIIB Brf1 subunit/transcription initiation factor TFIIB